MTTPTTTNKIPLAEHRYGREEMLLFYSDSPPFPHNMANIPTLVRTQPVSPIAMFPPTPEEQVKSSLVTKFYLLFIRWYSVVVSILGHLIRVEGKEDISLVEEEEGGVVEVLDVLIIIGHLVAMKIVGTIVQIVTLIGLTKGTNVT